MGADTRDVKVDRKASSIAIWAGVSLGEAKSSSTLSGRWFSSITLDTLSAAGAGAAIRRATSSAKAPSSERFIRLPLPTFRSGRLGSTEALPFRSPHGTRHQARERFYFERRRLTGSPAETWPVMVSCLTVSSPSDRRASDRVKSSPWIDPVTPPVSSDQPPTLMLPVTLVPFLTNVIVTGTSEPRDAALPVHTPVTLVVGALADPVCARSAVPQPAVSAAPSAIAATIARLIRLGSQLTRSERPIILDFRPSVRQRARTSS